MPVTIVDSDRRFSIEAHGQTILDALRDQGIDLVAPCGGRKICGKCQVLVRDGSGLYYTLACRTSLEDGMEILLEQPQPMVVQDGGIAPGENGLRDVFMLDTWLKAHPEAADSSEAVGGHGQAGYGLAVDIGTTTIVCRLYERETGTLHASAGRVNPQVIFGADVVSRIDASMDGLLDDMCDLVRSVVVDTVEELCHAAGIDRKDLRDAVLVGNTVMEHIAARIPPDSIGVAPYEPSATFGEYYEFEPIVSKAYFAPAIAGYVGGDVAAGILAADVRGAPGLQVYMDLGTNGELVLGCGGSLVACATAAGPVFEGAAIRCGMPARAGAIAGLSFDGGNPVFSVIGDVEPMGICGTGLIAVLAFMLDQGIVDETGRLLASDDVPPIWSCRVEEREGKRAFFLDEGHTVCITQEDIRNVQLAKAAICAGIMTLLEERGCAIEAVDSLVVAGGFGSYLDIEAAARIGLFPPGLKNRVRSVGNMAIEGASLLLVAPATREIVCEIASACEYVELSTSAVFSKRYLECMMFPASFE